jgi:hypothetical protein
MGVALFGACSAFTARCNPHARRVTKVTLYTRGFSRFVTSHCYRLERKLPGGSVHH